MEMDAAALPEGSWGHPGLVTDGEVTAVGWIPSGNLGNAAELLPFSAGEAALSAGKSRNS